MMGDLINQLELGDIAEKTKRVATWELLSVQAIQSLRISGEYFYY
jgi:hypothetical protein